MALYVNLSFIDTKAVQLTIKTECVMYTRIFHSFYAVLFSGVYQTKKILIHRPTLLIAACLLLESVTEKLK